MGSAHHTCGRHVAHAIKHFDYLLLKNTNFLEKLYVFRNDNQDNKNSQISARFSGKLFHAYAIELKHENVKTRFWMS